MSEKSDKLRAMLEKEKERRIKLNNRIEILERRIQEEDSAEVNEMVRTAKVTPEQLAALLRQSATTTPNPAALSAVGATFEKEVDADLEGNGYLVSWCVGHLVELAPPNVYDAKYVKWSIADLPILPQKWQYLVSASTKKQFGILQKLMHRPDVDSIVNSCDAGQCGWVT